MPPGGEAVGDVGLETQDDPAAKGCRRHHHGDGRQVAGTQEGNAQKGHEEDQRRAEVAHQRQASHTVGGKQNGEDQIPLGEQPVQGSGPGQNKGDLHQLRGLEGERPDGDPVFCAEDALAQHHVKGQQRSGGHSHRPPGPDGQMQVPQHSAHDQKQHHAHDHGNEQLVERARVIGGRHRRAHADEQEHQGLQLIGGPLGRPVYAIQDPGQQRQSAEGDPHRQPILCLSREKYLQKQEGLTQVHQHQSPCLGGAPPLLLLHPPPGHLGLVGFRGGEEVHLHAAHGDAVPGLQRRRGQGPLSVEQHPAAVVHRVYRPLAPVIPADGGVAPRHGGEVHPHVGAAHPTDHILPVGQVVPGAVGQADKAPHLRCLPIAEQGPAAAQQHPHCRCRQQDPPHPQRRGQRGGQA